MLQLPTSAPVIPDHYRIITIMMANKVMKRRSQLDRGGR